MAAANHLTDFYLSAPPRHKNGKIYFYFFCPSIPILKDELAIALKAVAIHDRATLNAREERGANAAERASLFGAFGKADGGVRARLPVPATRRRVLHIGDLRVLIHIIENQMVVGQGW